MIVSTAVNICIIVLYCYLSHNFVAGILVSSNHNKVLVIGGTGRVGSLIVSKLLKKGIIPHVLVRDIEKAKQNKQLDGSIFFQGDVSSDQSMNDILEASRDCQTIIDVHGCKPSRFFQLKDLLFHPRYYDKRSDNKKQHLNNDNDYINNDNNNYNKGIDNNHPYHVNYLGIKRILVAMKINKINKLIRITGALVDKNEFLPFIVLFNFLLSKSNKWQCLSEKAIREASIDYTVIRPTNLFDSSIEDISGTSNSNFISTKLILIPGDSNVIPKVPSQISIQDVSDLCIRAIDDNRLCEATLVCSSETSPLGENAMNSSSSSSSSSSRSNISNDWNQLISSRQSWKDSKLIRHRYYNAAIAIYAYLLSMIVFTTTKFLKFIIKSIMRSITKYVY